MEPKSFLTYRFLVLNLFFIGVSSKQPCTINLNSFAETPLFRPFVLTTDGDFFVSRNDILKINHNQKAFITCQNNYFKKFHNTNSLTITCIDDSLIIDGDRSVVKFKDLSCDLRIIEELKHNVPNCAKGNEGILYSYFDKSRQTSIKMAEVCYDFQKDRIIFVRTYLSNKFPALEMEIPQNDHLSNTDFNHRISIMQAYRPDKIQIKLNQVLGDEIDTFNLIRPVKLLPKLFFDEQLQDVQKFPTNNVGLWNTVALGNWKRVINDINNLVKESANTHEVILGTHDTLSVNGKMLYLGDNTIPVPKYLWAIVFDKKSKKGTAVVTINNPFTTSQELKENIFCESVCSKVPWLEGLLKNNNNDRPYYGYTFCCNLNNFDVFPMNNVV